MLSKHDCGHDQWTYHVNQLDEMGRPSQLIAWLVDMTAPTWYGMFEDT